MATATPTPDPTPTPTVEGQATAHLSAIIPWITDPPDDHHAAAARAIIDTWLRDADFGEAVARIPWVLDGIQQDETSLLAYAREVAGADPKSSPGSPWHVGSEVQASSARVIYIDMLVLIAAEMKHSPDLAQALLDFQEIAVPLFEDHKVAEHLATIAYFSDIESILPVVGFASRHDGDLLRHLLNTMAVKRSTSRRISIGSTIWNGSRTD